MSRSSRSLNPELIIPGSRLKHRVVRVLKTGGFIDVKPLIGRPLPVGCTKAAANRWVDLQGTPINFADFLAARVIGYFDQIQVGVTEIHRHHRSPCPVSFHRASDEANAA